MSFFDSTKPLGLPEGSVRAGMTLGAVFVAGLLMLLGIQLPDWYVGLITLVVNQYFQTRGTQ